MSEQLFYIVSLKHTSKGDTALTFWGPNGSGYTWHKARAGRYTKDQLTGSTSEDNVAVPVEAVDKLWKVGFDFNDPYKSVPNNKLTLGKLGLSDKLLKPKKMASCRINFDIDDVELFLINEGFLRQPWHKCPQGYQKANYPCYYKVDMNAWCEWYKTDNPKYGSIIADGIKSTTKSGVCFDTLDQLKEILESTKR